MVWKAARGGPGGKETISAISSLAFSGLCIYICPQPRFRRRTMTRWADICRRASASSMTTHHFHAIFVWVWSALAAPRVPNRVEFLWPAANPAKKKPRTWPFGLCLTKPNKSDFLSFPPSGAKRAALPKVPTLWRDNGVGLFSSNQIPPTCWKVVS